MSKRGLPSSLVMRHDEHYVEALAASAGVPIGRLVAIEQIDPNPNQPRQVMGDLSELIASIVEKGILEPLVVRQRGDRFQIIAGERRYQAAVQAGLRDLPAVIRDVDDTEMLEIALIENLQRKDLTAFEEAEGLLVLVERFGYTHEEVARRIGKSRSSVTEALSIALLPGDIKEECRRADIHSKSLLLQVVRQPGPEPMRKFIKRISDQGLNRDDARRMRTRAAKKARPRPFIYRYSQPDRDFALEVKFRRSAVSRGELMAALKEALAELEKTAK